MTIETSHPPHPLAIFSLSCAILTLLSFCGGVAPVPGTGWVCFPAALFFGLLALVSGIVALGRIRATGTAGRGLALAGAWTGGLTILATLCAIVLTILAVSAIVSQFLNQAQH